MCIRDSLQAKDSGQVLMTAVQVENLMVELVDKPKGECGDNCANAGYFANYSEAGEPFTLPVGHLVGGYKAAGKWTRHYCQERGQFQGDKFTFDSGGWSYANSLHGKAVSTLLISGGKARVEEIRTVPDGTDSVSYTHLDVYKRQDQCPAGWSWLGQCSDCSAGLYGSIRRIG